MPVNYLAVFLAALASMLLGYVWYGPLFGKAWMALSGMTAAKIEAVKSKGMSAQYSITFVGSLVMSYVLAHSLVFASSYFKVSGISSGLMVGFWNWLGFVAPVTLGTVLWDGKSWKLWFLNNGYYFTSLLIMGVILASF